MELSYRQPKLCDDVHYVSYGTPGGEYAPACRAAKVTEVHPVTDGTRAQAHIETWDYIPGEATLFVMNPSGTFHNARVLEDRSNRRGGTWHFPSDCASGS